MHKSLWRIRTLFRDLSRPRLWLRLPSSGLWRQSDFLKLWLALTVSSLGSEVTTLALPLTAVLFLGAGPAQMGILEALGPVPFLLIGLFAGVWVDRVRRRPVLILADLGRAILLAWIPVAALLGVLRIEHLYAVAFLVGVLTVLEDLAGTAFMPTVVARADLVEANSKETVTTSGAGIAGPGIAGFLVQIVSAPLAILVDSLSFLISAVCLGMIRTVEPVPQPAERRPRMYLEIGVGLRFLLSHRILRPILLSGGMLNLLSGVLQAVFLLYYVRTLGLTAATIGLLQSMRAVGFLLGALLVPTVTRRLGLGPTLAVGAFLMGLGVLVILLADGPYTVLVSLIVVGNLLNGLGNPFMNVNASSLRQAVTPDHLLGRMQAGYRFIGRGGLPIGALAGGILGATVGIRETLAVGLVGFMLAPLWLYLSPVVRMRTAPAAATPD